MRATLLLASTCPTNGIPVTGFNGSSAWGQFENYFGAVASGGAAPVPTPVSTGADFLVEQGVENLGAVTYAFPAAVDAAEQYLTAFESVTGNAGTHARRRSPREC